MVMVELNPDFPKVSIVKLKGATVHTLGTSALGSELHYLSIWILHSDGVSFSIPPLILFQFDPNSILCSTGLCFIH